MTIDEAIRRTEEDLAVLKRARDIMLANEPARDAPSVAVVAPDDAERFVAWLDRKPETPAQAPESTELLSTLASAREAAEALPMVIIPAGDTERAHAWKERQRCHIVLEDPDDLLSRPVAGEAQS